MKKRPMTLDLHPANTEPPSRGDIVTTARAAYRVAEIRPVESRVWTNRWKLELERLPSGSNADPPIPREEGQRVHVTSSYARGQGPREFFGAE